MGYVKVLGAVAVAVAVAIAVLGSSTASATVLCSAKENPCSSANKWPVNTVLKFSLKSGTSAKLVDTENEVLDTCTGSNFEGKLGIAGSSTTTVTGGVSSLTWSGCTFTTDTTQLGNLEGHVSGTGPNGTLTADGEFKVTLNSILFGSCVYGVTIGTSLGTLMGGGEGEALLVAATVVRKLGGSSLVCPETTKWSAEYVSTASTALFVAAS